MTRIFRIALLAQNTVREAIRNRLLYTLLFFALLMIGTSVLVSTLSYVERERIVQDLGLSAIRLFGVSIAIFVGVGLIHGEVERRTIFTILSKPLSRAEFLLGKYFGLVLTTWLMQLIMAAAFVAVSLAVGAPVDAGHGAALLLSAAEVAVVSALATFFSAFTTPILSSLFTVGLFAIGHLTRDLRQLGQQADLASVREAARLAHQVLPDLESFNLSIAAVHGLPISAQEVGLALLYGAGYAALVLMAATAVFARRDFR